MPLRTRPATQSETAPAVPRSRRHFSAFNKESHIPDANERPFTVNPTPRANMRVNEESQNHFQQRPCRKMDVPRPVTKEAPEPKRPPSRVNVSNVDAVIDGTSQAPTHRRMTKHVETSPPVIRERPVKSFHNHTTTLDRGIW